MTEKEDRATVRFISKRVAMAFIGLLIIILLFLEYTISSQMNQNEQIIPDKKPYTISNQYELKENNYTNLQDSLKDKDSRVLVGFRNKYNEYKTCLIKKNIDEIGNDLLENFKFVDRISKLTISQSLFFINRLSLNLCNNNFNYKMQFYNEKSNLDICILEDIIPSKINGEIIEYKPISFKQEFKDIDIEDLLQESNLGNTVITTFFPRYLDQTISASNESTVIRDNSYTMLSLVDIINFIHSDLNSGVSQYTGIYTQYGKRIINNYSATLLKINPEQLRMVQRCGTDGYSDNGEKTCFPYKVIKASDIEGTPENFYFMGDGKRLDYLFFEQFIPAPICAYQYDKKSDNVISYLSVDPALYEKAEFVDFMVIHERGKWNTYAIVNGLNIYFDNGSPDKFNVFEYPSYSLLSDEVTKNIVGEMENPIRCYEEIVTNYNNVRDFFVKGKDDIMGVLEKDQLRIYLTPYDIESVKSVELGDDPRIVMLEWLTEAEYKDWEEYFKMKEEVQ